MNKDLEIAYNSAIGEMEQLVGVTNVRFDESGIWFECKNRGVLRLMATIGSSIDMEYRGKAAARISGQTGDYLVAFSCDEGVDLGRVILSFASSIDAAACDAPRLFKGHHEQN